jgi:hypothetical protein
MPMLLVVPRAITIEVAIDAIICTMNFNGFSLYFLSVSLISLSRDVVELICDRFWVSKKAFKKAVGDLYKRRLITIADDGIHLTK